jgi:hypothetical protein
MWHREVIEAVAQKFGLAVSIRQSSLDAEALFGSDNLG